MRMKRDSGLAMEGSWRTLGAAGLALACALLVPLPAPAAVGSSQFVNRTVGPDHIVAVGFAFDAADDANPATIAFLFEDWNAGILKPGDVILEYRGASVGSGSELYQTISAAGRPALAARLRPLQSSSSPTRRPRGRSAPATPRPRRPRAR
jgi:hypothetical protein